MKAIYHRLTRNRDGSPMPGLGWPAPVLLLAAIGYAVWEALS